MLDDKKIRQLEVAFKRILLMPMSRGSFRQMQNAILYCVEGNREQASRVLEAILVGDQQPNQNDSDKLSDNNAIDGMKEFIERYSIPINVAKDVAERGDFLSLITSDIIGHPKLALFNNRIKRVDGEEFHFLADVEGIIHVLHHFAVRLQEMDRVEKSKAVLKGLKEELTQLKTHVEQLLLASD